MNRRQFTKTLGLSALALGAPTIFAAKRKGPRIAITMDDFNWANAVHQSASERNSAILDTFRSHSLKGAIFVVGRNIEDEQGKDLLKAWNGAGHLIGNHTYSHQNYNSPSISLQSFRDDILRAEQLLTSFTAFQRYFRFPMLKEGETREKRDGLRTFFAEKNYRVGHVTIDTSDWLVDQRLSARLKENPKADVKRYRDFYLQHMWDRAQYYDSLARRVTGRVVNHTLLTHYNLLNGLFLNDLIVMFKSKGWEFIDALEAFQDPVFSAKPNILPAGESIIWSLAKEKGTIPMSQRYPAEDGNVELDRMKKLGL
ncbi:MAG TPA: polysaccharide deacetylase family protein [Pyrinomonadaceae bacterium]